MILTRSEFQKINSGCEGITAEQFRDLHRFALSEEGQKLLQAGNGWVKTRSSVGVIATRSGLTLQIIPKIYRTADSEDQYVVAQRVLLAMLRALQPWSWSRQTDDAALKTARMPLLELFIRLFLDEVQQVIRTGLHRYYKTCQADQNFLRGQLLVGAQLRRNTVHRERFACRFDSFSADIPVNRILKSTLLLVQRFSQLEMNRQLIREQLAVFDDVSSAVDPLQLLQTLVIDRTVNRYQRALYWAQLLLSGQATTSWHGSTVSFSLLFPMERLFESFVYRQLQQSGLFAEQRAQSSQYSLAREQGKAIFQLKPDLVGRLKNGDRLLLLDTKWKLLDETDRESKYGISQNDLYQLLSYATVYKAESQKETAAVLIYPVHDGFTELRRFQFCDSNKTPLTVVPFDLLEAVENSAYCKDFVTGCVIEGERG